jgi:hypothetical protein
MATNSEEVELVLSLKDEMSKGFKKLETNAKKSLGDVDKNSKKATNSIMGMSKSVLKLGASIGVAATALKAFNMVKEVNANKDAVLNLSNATGIMVKDLSALQFSAELNKTSFDSLKGGLQKMSMTISQAQLNSKNAQLAFSNLGVSIKDDSGELRNLNDIFLDVSDALKNTENDTDRLTKAQQIFGRNAAQMSTLLMQGSDALREQAKEAEALGVVFDRKLAEDAAKFNDELLRMESKFSAIGRTLVETVTPALGNFLETWNQILKGENTDSFIKGQAEFGVTWAKANSDLKLTIALQEQLNKIIADGSGKFLGRDITAAEAGVQLDLYDEIEDKELKEIERLKQIAIQNKFITNEIRAQQAAAEKAKGNKPPALTGGGSGASQAVAPQMSDEHQFAIFDAEGRAEDRNKVLRSYGEKHIETLREQALIEQQIREEANQKELEEREVMQADQEKRLGEAQKWADAKLSIDQSLRDSAETLANAAIQSAANALSSEKDSANKRKAIALAQVLMSGAVASGKVWADLGWPAAIGPQIQIAAQTTAQAAVIGSQRFEDGGIVGGNSYSGDRVTAMVNSGERIMNNSQQNRLDDILFGGNSAPSGGGATTVQLVLDGRVLSQAVVDANQRNLRTNRPVGTSF